jgi:hypothetical protein
MPNKKINQLTPRTPTLTDLILVGDPATGYSYKATLSAMVNFVGGNIQFSSLGGISLTNPTNGQVLTFNGTNWVNQTPATAPVSSVFGRTGAVVAAEGDYSLTQLSDVTISSPTNGQVLKYNGTAWVNGSDTDTGITSLNGLTATTQTFATGTSGTDFNISSATSAHTFNLPTASATNRGALSSSDWTTFNTKQNAITLATIGNSGAATFISNTLNIPNYTLAGLGGITLNSLAASSPLSYDSITGIFSIQIANSTQNGYLSSLSFNTFTNKQNAITLTTTGSSGSATFVSDTLNIPTYTLAGLGGISLSSLSASAPLSYNSGTGAFSITQASGSTNGFLSSTDWTTFNNKQSTITLTTTGSSGAATFVSNTLNIPNYTLAGLGGVSGSGTTNYVSKFTGSSALGNSQIFDNGTNVGIITTSPTNLLTLVGSLTGRGIDFVSQANFASVTGKINYETTNDLFSIINTSSWGNSALIFGTSNTERMRISQGGNVGIGTTSINSSLEIYKASGPNYIYLTNGTSGTNNGVVLRFNNIDYMGMIGTFTTGELKVGGFNASGYFMTFYSNNSERMRLTPSGRLLLGTTTESTYLLDVNGTARVSGTELRLDNGTTGVINLYSTTPSIQFASFDPTNYRFYRSGTTMYWNSAGNIRLQIAGNEAYQIDASNGHILRSAISGGAALARLTTGGNFIIGTTTDLGEKVYINAGSVVQMHPY